MSILNVDTSNPELTKKFNYEPVPPATYVCEVANDLKLEASKSNPDNSVVAVELVITDDGEFKGKKIFDNLVVAKEEKARKACERKIAQFTKACGLDLDNIDLELFKGCSCEVEVGVKTETYKGETKSRNFVKNYLFEGQE